MYNQMFNQKLLHCRTRKFASRPPVRTLNPDERSSRHVHSEAPPMSPHPATGWLTVRDAALLLSMSPDALPP